MLQSLVESWQVPCIINVTVSGIELTGTMFNKCYSPWYRVDRYHVLINVTVPGIELTGTMFNKCYSPWNRVDRYHVLINVTVPGV